jgi:hypothetical protein
MCSSDEAFYLVEKLRKGKESIYGGCGDWDKLLKFYQAIETSGDIDSDTDVTILELRNDGIWIYESTIIPARIKNDFWAIGTASGYAIASMHLGLSPGEAVAVACLYDTSSHGPIDTMTLARTKRGQSNSK